jgi:uncharacterized protein involved in exopolysaccharide biosynthesis
MLQKLEFDQDMQEESQSNLLRPIYYWELLKRRIFYFAIPFVLVVSSGVGLARLWPPTYLSEGKILPRSASKLSNSAR